MNEKELESLEREAQPLLDLLKEQRDKENNSLELPAQAPRPKECRPQVSRRIAPYWLAAAALIGFLAGFAIPRNNSTESAGRLYTEITDSTQGVSMAQNDVNCNLLVKL